MSMHVSMQVMILLGCCSLLFSASFATAQNVVSGAKQEAEAAATVAATFTDLDLFNLEWASDPRVSPDGKTIAYTRNSYDIMRDRSTARIWLIDRNGDNHRPLTDRAGRAPRWSPDGQRIVFTAGTPDEGTEVFMHWLADNRTARLTQLPETPGALTWSPDGEQLAMILFTPTAADAMIKMPSAPKGAKWAPNAKLIESLHYRSDGRGFLREGTSHVYVMPADGGTPRQVTSGIFRYVSGLSWSDDGKALFVSANRREDWERQTRDTEIYRVELDTGTFSQLTERYGPDTSPVLSPDGTYLAYTGYDDRAMGYHNSQIHVLNLASGEDRVLTAGLDRGASRPIWSDNSRGVYYAYTEEGADRVVYQSIKADQPSRVVANNVGGLAMTRPYSGGQFHSAAGTTVFTYSTPLRPAELAVAEGKGHRLLTALNEDALAHKQLAQIEAIRFPSSHDDRSVQAWVAKPPGFEAGKRYPLILEIHGGPYAAYGPHWGSEIQLMAAAGYLVLYVNPRGSTSYGDEFANLIQHDYPGDDYYDLISAVDYVIEQGWADAERLFVTGGSGGGILSAWIITRTDRFRAAVAQKPVINWYSMTYTSDMYTSMFPYWFAKPPWEDPMPYLNRSPIQFVDQVNTPTMLLTGEQDWRTPMSESEQFYQALQLNGVKSALVRIPESSHAISARPSNLLRKVKYILAWFARHDSSPQTAGESAEDIKP